jgi:hypothetical protein
MIKPARKNKTMVICPNFLNLSFFFCCGLRYFGTAPAGFGSGFPEGFQLLDDEFWTAGTVFALTGGLWAAFAAATTAGFPDFNGFFVFFWFFLDTDIFHGGIEWFLLDILACRLISEVEREAS